MAIHTIHLRGPWRIAAEARTLWTGESESIDLPSVEPLPGGGMLNPVGDWSPLLGLFRGRVRYERGFGQPTGLEEKRLFLVIEGVDAMARVTLNDRDLGCIVWGEEKAWDISQCVRDRNRLTLRIDLPQIDANSAPLFRDGREDSDAGGLIGGVRLEIREPHASA